jgi:general secretion pathway protein H
MTSAKIQRGFTLVELLVVMVVIGLAYSLVPPLFSSGASSAELKAAARQIATGLRRARSEAISKRQEAVLELDIRQHTFRITGDGHTYKLPHQVDVALHTAQSEVQDMQAGSIRFYPDGSSTGGRINLAGNGQNYQVDVDWMTGRVTINK